MTTRKITIYIDDVNKNVEILKTKHGNSGKIKLKPMEKKSLPSQLQLLG